MTKDSTQRPRITEGMYRTREGQAVHITRIVVNRAYGHIVSTTDTTWWYVDTGEHGLYTPDDLVERLD